MSNPHEWHIASDREGFFIEDEYGEEVLPPWLSMCVNPVSGERTGWRCQGMDTAKRVLDETIRHALDNYESPETGDAWSGGFADNH